MQEEEGVHRLWPANKTDHRCQDIMSAGVTNALHLVCNRVCGYCRYVRPQCTPDSSNANS